MIRTNYVEKTAFDKPSLIIFRDALEEVGWKAYRSFSASNYEALRALLLDIDKSSSGLSKAAGPGLLFETIFRAADELLIPEEQNELIEHLLNNRIN
jgi:hypothetical protein